MIELHRLGRSIKRRADDVLGYGRVEAGLRHERRDNGGELLPILEVNQHDGPVAKVTPQADTVDDPAATTFRSTQIWAWLTTIGFVRWFLVALCVDAGLFLALHGTLRTATQIAALVLVAVTILTLSPEKVRELSARGFELGVFGLTAKLPALSGDPAEDEAEHRVSDLIELKLLMQRKLTYVAKHVLGQPGRPSSITLGSMVTDNQLTEPTARICAVIDALRVPSTTDRSGRSVEDWLLDAQRAVASLRIEVLTESLATRLVATGRLSEANSIAFTVERDVELKALPRAMTVRALHAPPGTEIVVVPVFSFGPTTKLFVRSLTAARTLGRPFVLVCPPNYKDDPRAKAESGQAVRLDDAVTTVEQMLRKIAAAAPNT